jgi:elongation factor G
MNNKDYQVSTNRIRNIGIAAHIDAGKTTTTERMLFYSGVVHKMGEVHQGTAVTDWMEQEKERGITITSASISLEWKHFNKKGLFFGKHHRINIIDTPGHVDFTAEVERSLRVLDGSIGIFCAVAGVQSQSETVWMQMNKYSVPRIVFINKMDRNGSNFLRTISDIQEKLRTNIQPLYLPILKSNIFVGLIDLISMKSIIYNHEDTYGLNPTISEIPIELMKKSNKYRKKLIENLADCDDIFAEKYINDEKISIEDIQKAIRINTINLKFVGAIPGSSFKNKGVQMLLDSVVDFLPTPLDSLKANINRNKNSLNEKIIPEIDNYILGIVFKIMTDSYVGKLTFFRIYSGVLKRGDVLYNPRTKKKERISRLIIMKANDREDVNIVCKGDICAIVGIKNVVTGDTLRSIKGPDIIFEPPTFPDPVISMSLEPKNKSDQEKLSFALQRLSEEDPTFIVSSNYETKQTIVSGMGELHLEIIKDRLLREFNVESLSGSPQISYKETIKNFSMGEGKFIKQSGGRGQYGHVILKLKPLKRGSGIILKNKIVGGVIPKEYIKPTKEGILEGANIGVTGYPVTDFQVEIIDGSYHEVDSSEIAFKIAGIMAFRDALKKSNSFLIEPIMKVEVTTPKEYQGGIVGDLNKRRGKIQIIDIKDKLIVIYAQVPLQSMFGYSTNVRSLSKGRANYSMEFFNFEEVPKNIAEKITKSH